MYICIYASWLIMLQYNHKLIAFSLQLCRYVQLSKSNNWSFNLNFFL